MIKGQGQHFCFQVQQITCCPHTQSITLLLYGPYSSIKINMLYTKYINSVHMSYSWIMLNWFYLWIFVNNNQCFGGSYSRFMNQHEWLHSGTHSELYVICKVSSMHPHFWCKYFSLELFCLYNIRIVRPFWLIMLLQLGGFEHKNQYYDFTTVHSNTLNNYIPMSLSFLSDSNNQ